MTYTPGGGGASTFLGLTDSPSSFTGQDGKVAAVNAAEDALEFVTGGGGGGGGLDWTTSEQDTGLTWHDGETVYQKTIVQASLSDGPTVSTIAHSIVGMSEVVHWQGIVKRSNGQWHQLGMPALSGSFSIQVGIDTTNIEYAPGSGWNGGSGVDLSDLAITIFYTKV